MFVRHEYLALLIRIGRHPVTGATIAITTADDDDEYATTATEPEPRDRSFAMISTLQLAVIITRGAPQPIPSQPGSSPVLSASAAEPEFPTKARITESCRPAAHRRALVSSGEFN